MRKGPNSDARCAVDSLEAIVAMPGLDELGAVLVRHGVVRRDADAVSWLAFVAARWEFKSANQVDAMFQDPATWARLAHSAGRVGRVLSAKPMTFDRFRHGRDQLNVSARCELLEVFTEQAVGLAVSAGLCATPTNDASRLRPRRHATVYGDGSVFEPLSSVTLVDGELHGSRAKSAASARIAARFQGKHGGDGGAGLPIALVGVHGAQHRQRAVLGIEPYEDHNEIGAAMRVFERVARHAGDGIDAAAYDGLLGPRYHARMLAMGVLPSSPMAQAQASEPHLFLPPELRDKDKPAGRTHSGEKVKPKAAKSRVKVRRLGIHDHSTPAGACAHLLWAVDGTMVTTAIDEMPTLDSTVAPVVALERLSSYGKYEWWTTWRVPCRYGSFLVHMDLAGPDFTARQNNGPPPPLFSVLRPIPETDPYFKFLAGLRNDVESGFRTLDANLPIHGRASSLAFEHFVLDLIGGGLWVNAQLWDDHIARHTLSGRRNAEILARRTTGTPASR